MLRPTWESREAALSSDKEASSDVAVNCAQYDIKGGNKRRKQHFQGTTAVTRCDNGHGWGWVALAWDASRSPRVVTRAGEATDGPLQEAS
jgi:hypothetical protein